MKFISRAVLNIKSQTYPEIEWVVVGDMSRELEEAYTKTFTESNIHGRYVACDIQGDIGRKRNFGVSQCSSDVVVCMDDDDFYFPGYVEYSVESLKKALVTGCKDMMIYFTAHDKIKYTCGNKIHEGTLAFYKSYWKSHPFLEGVAHGEGNGLFHSNKRICNNELDIRKVMVCVAHGENTFSKDNLLELCPDVEIPFFFQSFLKTFLNI
jgi:glycosyltransferase involved in cell wall biosynthesis